MTYVGVEDLLKNKLGAKLEEKSLTPGSYLSFNSGDILIGNIRPYLKKIWFADRPGLTNGDVLVIRAKGAQGLQVSARYLMQVLSSDSFFDHLVSNSKGAKMPRGDKSTALNFRLSFPSLEKQKYIAHQLDSLSELVSSSISGIPAEINARRKQFEHYRNRLLTFKELKAS
jgi:type I restriction enzyme S subunit